MMKRGEPLTREQYLKKFSRAVRWRLPPQESEDAIADYRELILLEERDEARLVEELGEPVQAAHLLTDVRTYRRWLKVFAVLAFGLFLIVEWVWTGRYSLTFAALARMVVSGAGDGGGTAPVSVLVPAARAEERPSAQAAGAAAGGSVPIRGGNPGLELVCVEPEISGLLS